MTAARPATVLFFSQLMLDYLNTAASAVAGVPDEAALPKIILDSGSLQKVPGLVITAQEKPGSHGQRAVEIVFALLYHNRATGADAAADAASLARSTLFIEASRMHDLIASRLADRAAFRDYLSTLNLHQSHGVSIMHYRRLPDPVLQREDKPTPRHELMCAVEIHALWRPQALAA